MGGGEGVREGGKGGGGGGGSSGLIGPHPSIPASS